ncbi:MAG: hypothetical protein CMJ49_06915 [Planctomycetaceae bacterium]|nr:hypothetical protein [Planctomycetaceae bacterium]
MAPETEQAQQNVRAALRQFEAAADSAQPPTPVMQQVLGPLVETTGSQGAVVWMPADAAAQSFRAAGRFGGGAGLVVDEQQHPTDAVIPALREAWSQRKPAVIGPQQATFANTALHDTTQFLLPIQQEDRGIGLLELICPGSLDPKVYREFAAFAQQAADALGKYLARRRDAVGAQDTANIQATLRITQHLLTLGNPREVVEDLAHQTRSMMGATQAAVVAFGSGRPIVAFADVVQPNNQAVRVRNAELLGEAVRARGTPMSFVADQAIEDEDEALAPLVHELFTVSHAQGVTLTPIRSGETAVGAMLLEYDDAEIAGQRATAQQEICDAVAGVLAHAQAWQARPLRRLSNAIASVHGRPRSAMVKAGITLGIVAAVVVVGFFVPVSLPIKADARLEPAQMALVTMPQEGRIEACLVAAGQEVAAGDPLYRLDDQDWQLQLDDLRSKMESAIVALYDMHREGDPAKIARQNLELKQMELKQRSLLRSIDRCMIRSPIAGVVLTRNPDQLVGRTMSVGQDMVEVAQLDEFRLIMDVPEADLALVDACLTEGKAVTVEFISRAWPDALQDATIESSESMSATSHMDMSGSRFVFQVIVPIDLKDMPREALPLANASGRAKLIVGDSSIAFRYGREALGFLRMTLLF